MTAVDSDIDSFIRQQKAKLANERQILNNLDEAMDYRGGNRRRWRPPVDLDTLRAREMEEYKRTWFELKGKHLEPGSHRKQWGSAVKLSPRGVLDTNALILDVQKEKEREAYIHKWRQLHEGKEPSSRGPYNRGAGGEEEPHDPRIGQEYLSPSAQRRAERDAYRRLWEQQHPEGHHYRPAQNIAMSNTGCLDTDAIIREVQREKREDEGVTSAGGGRPGDDLPARGRGVVDKDEYRKLWEQQQAKKGDEIEAGMSNLLIKEDGRLERVRQMERDRNKEYNNFLAQKQVSVQEKYGLAPEFDEAEDFGLFHTIGAADKQIRREPPNQLNLLGENLYDKSIRRGYQGRPLREQTDEYKATFGANESDAAKLQKIKDRNEEYNQFLASKPDKERNRLPERRPPADDGIYATIPGLRYSTSAQRREMQAERNKEYNQMLRQKTKTRNQPSEETKQGWGTPTYEKILDKKRAQESNYRRANDAAYESDLPVQETERRIRELHHDLAVNNALDFEPGTPALVMEQKKVLSRLQEVSESFKNIQDTGTRGPSLELAPVQGHGDNQKESSFFATLPLGSDSHAEKYRRQEEYKRDLQRQMAETAYARRKEKEQGLLINNTGIANSETTRVIFEPPEPRRKDPQVEAYHTKILEDLKKLDDISPRSNALLGGRRQPTEDRRLLGGLNLAPIIKPAPPINRGGGGGILDLGFDSLLEPTRLTSLEPPPGLHYQPSTFITSNALPTMNSSVDEAYNFYASHNPLEPVLSSGHGRAGGARGGDVPVPSLDLSRVGKDGGQASRVHFRGQERAQSAATGMEFQSDAEKKLQQRHQQKVYREELERQMVERNWKRQKDKEEQEKYDLKMEEEARNYDPYGKGGGGAPMKDQYGNVITDLRQMRSDNLNKGDRFSPGTFSAPGHRTPYETMASGIVTHAGNTTRAATSYRDDLIGPPPAQQTAEGETSFARGGHGIFGMPKTQAEKVQADKYKQDLQRQIEEKKAEEYRKKQMERLEEERQQKLLDEQRSKMQSDYDEEQRKVREKEEEARRKNEEMIRAAEDTKRENDRRKREAEELRRQELREEQEMREQVHALSPPVPATRTKAMPEPSPGRQEHRAQSADVLNQLAQMRAQLQNERRRVQHMLDDQQDDVDIYDPRVVQQQHPSVADPVGPSRSELDVFETAMNRNAVAVRRTPADRANPQAVQEFNALKHKTDSDSRKQFRQMYPSEPMSSEALESQQTALLRQQEDKLQHLRERRSLEDTSSLHLNRDIGSSSSQLQSNSAFVDVTGLAQFPDDFEDLPQRNALARDRRRLNRVPSSPRMTTPDLNSRATFGSQTSLGIDYLAKKNEARLRKLRELQGDNVSLYDPEDVLERFMSKQGHNRAPSRNTLLDDTWVSKPSKY